MVVGVFVGLTASSEQQLVDGHGENFKYVLSLLRVVLSLAIEALTLLLGPPLVTMLDATLFTTLVSAGATVAGRLNLLLVTVRSTTLILLLALIFLATSTAGVLRLLVLSLAVTLGIAVGRCLVMTSLGVGLSIRSILTVALLFLALLLVATESVSQNRAADTAHKTSDKSAECTTTNSLSRKFAYTVCSLLDLWIASALATAEVVGHTKRLAATMSLVMYISLVVTATLYTFTTE